MSIIVDFFKKTGHLPCHHHFADNDFIKSGFKVPPEKALEWLKKRGDKLKLTVNWDDLNSEAHNKSFTVAKVLTADLLQNFYNLVEKAKSEGWSLEKFQEEALPYAEQTGWTGNKLHRLRIIYNTNMMTAYARGKYQQQSLLAKNGLYPYLEYLPSSSEEPNPLHKKFYGLVLKFDDPFWNSFYPPSRFGCQCSTRSVSQKEIDDRKLNIVNGNDLIQSILKDPQLSKYYELENKSKLNVLKAWKPATNIYVRGIKQQLEKFLNSKVDQLSDEYKKLFENPKYDLSSVDDNVVNDFAKNVLGKNWTKEDFAKMTGALTDSKFIMTRKVKKVNKIEYDALEVVIKHNEFIYYIRDFYKDTDGKIKIHNDYFKPLKNNKMPKGVGAMALYKEITEARKYGIENFQTYAFGNFYDIEEWSGYYVWPYFGFNANVPQDFKDQIRSITKWNIQSEVDLYNFIKKCKSLNELFKNSHAALLWKRYGSNIETTFDSNPNSENYKILIDKLKNKYGVIL